MAANRVRVFEGTHVPVTFEKILVPRGEDPDGLGPMSDEDRRLCLEFKKVCKGSKPALQRLAKELYEHQKYQLKNSHVIADANGEPADNMNIEDISPWLAKLGVLTPNRPDHVFSESVDASRYGIATWVFGLCEAEGIPLELISAVAAWNDGGALESTAYPGDRAIDGDGNYPILVPDPADDVLDRELELMLNREFELLKLELPPEFLDLPPTRTQSRSFTDHQWPKGHCPNKAGRPRRPRETEDINDRRPHFFDTLMPPDSVGNQVTYGERVSDIARNRAAKDEDWVWLAQINAWARELYQICNRRKTFRNGGFVYEDTLKVTRIDIAIRHLWMVEIQWPKSPSARWVLRPWLVSEALEQMVEGDLTRKEMEGIYTRTKSPQHADWPAWWPEDLRCKHSKNEKLLRPRRKVSGTIVKE